MKNEIVKDYKTREIYGGVYGIRNKITGKIFLQPAVNIEGKEERFNFAVQTKSNSVIMQLRSDWNEYGAEAFEYVLYETLKRKEETDFEFKKIIEELYNEWREKLGDIVLN